MRKRIVGVIGGHKCNREVEQLSQDLGKSLAKVVDILVCGGLSGTMKAVCKGFNTGKGLTIGIIPGYNKREANAYIDIVIPSGLGLARNILVVKTAEIIVALPGESGTLSEVAYALQFGIPVVSLHSWDLPGTKRVDTVKEAINQVKRYFVNKGRARRWKR